MTGKLPRDGIERHISALRQRSQITAVQAARLVEVARLLDAGRQFDVKKAVDAAEFDDVKEFGEFCRQMNATAKAIGIPLAIELEAQNATPSHRKGWFTGADRIDEEISTFTVQTGHTGIDHPVAPEVTELSPSVLRKVYVSAASARNAAEARQLNRLVEELRDVLALSQGRTCELAFSGDVRLGQDPAAIRDELSAQADVRVALVSPSYFTGADQELGRVFQPGAQLVIYAFSALPDNTKLPPGVSRQDIRWRETPWNELRSRQIRRNYIHDLADHLYQALRSPSFRAGDAAKEATEEISEKHLSRWSDNAARANPAEGGSVHIEADAAETSLAESRLGSTGLKRGQAQPAVARLVAWATAKGADTPRMCALLGDVGMGKTTAARLFTQRLLELRKNDSGHPLPILFDLRDVRVNGLMETLTLDTLLDGMLDAYRPAGVPRELLCADTVRQRLHQGGAVVIFDGLDEVLVHLTPHDQQLFTRQLWRAITETPSARMLLTCRTQYFRTIRDEVTYFTGQDRQGIHGADYLALLILPFRESQIREYLASNVNQDVTWVDGFLATIGAVHDLSDLARRPLTLRLIADQVKFIEAAKLEGREIQSVDLYGEVVERWLARDSGKHTLTPEHKQLLMEEIAAGLWRSGRNSWGPVEVENWLLRLLDRRPDLRLHYVKPLPDLWKADFRTATFLARDGDKFAFGHRSLAEYFLARYFARILTRVDENDSLAELAMPVPNAETLDFLGQILAGASPEDRSNAISSLERLGRKYVSRASEFSLAYSLHSAQYNRPRQSLVGLDLQEAQLDGWQIGSSASNGPVLSMSGVSFRNANLRHAHFYRVDLSCADFRGADLTLTELHHCVLTNVKFGDADATGTLFRHCSIAGADLAAASMYRSQALWCDPAPTRTTQLLVAPQEGLKEASSAGGKLEILTGHTGGISSVCWSADSLRIVTGASDGARIWDATTGELLHYLSGPDGVVSSVAWSGDNKYIVTSGVLGAQIWDATTAELLRDVSDRAGNVHAVAWSQDCSRILTGGSSGVQIWDVATGRRLQHLIGLGGTVSSVAWSPDNKCILASGGITRIWDALTGKRLRHMAGHGGAVWSVAWSPDNKHVLTGGASTRIWDAMTGELIHNLTGQVGAISSVAWSPDNKHILIGGADGTRILDAITGSQLDHLAGQVGAISSVAWSPDNKHILTGGADGVQIWDAATTKLLHHLANHRSNMTVAAWSPNSRRLLIGGSDGARVWIPKTGKLVHHMHKRGGGVSAVAWSHDGEQLLTAGVDGLQIWNATTGARIRDLSRRGGPISSASWSPDDKRIVAGGANGAQVWDAATGRASLRLDAATAVAWTPEGRRLVISGGTTTRICDASTGEVLQDLTGHVGVIRVMTWSPDGRQLLTGGGDICVWNAQTGRIVHQLSGHGIAISSVAWSPDGGRLLTAGADIQIWNAVTGEPLQKLTGNSGIASFATWSPDNKTIMTVGSGGIQLWDAMTGAPRHHTFVSLSEGETAILNATTGELAGASPGAWRWLGWTVVEDGRTNRLPVEIYGSLPPIPTLHSAREKGRSVGRKT